MKPRDVEALYKKYTNLINSVYNAEKSRYVYKDSSGKPVYNKAKLDDLKSYIDYEFILLVREYDVGSGVDFPGYIKSKLGLRTKHSYIRKEFKYDYSMHYGDKSVDDLLSTQESSTDIAALDVDPNSPLGKALDKVPLTDLEKHIVLLWSLPSTSVSTSKTLKQAVNSDARVYKEIHKLADYEDLERKDFNKIASNLRNKLVQAIKNC